MMDTPIAAEQAMLMLEPSGVVPALQQREEAHYLAGQIVVVGGKWAICPEHHGTGLGW